ncbi:MAG: universal stress protein [Proteobacteria bacterium]|nr:universal stress protein [Pseudomonadota bacterium]
MQKVIAAVQPNDAYYEAVLLTAHRLAGGDRLRVVSIYPSPIDWVSEQTKTPEAVTRNDRRKMLLAIEADLERLGLRGCEVRVPVAQRANIGDNLVEAARAYEADLLVLGTHGRTGITALFTQSVAAHAVKHAPCDVHVVRKRA